MTFENKCMYCFEDLDGQSVCPHCGKDSRAAVPQIQLLPGTMLYHERFCVGRAMGQDANGIVYAAYDTKRGAKLRVREYLPRDSARRLNDGSVVPAAGAEDAFERGLARLKASVEAVEDPKKRHFYFEENGTGYVAQRKSAAAAREKVEAAPERGAKQWAVIIGAAALVVALVVFVLIRLLSNAFDATPDVVPDASLLASDSLWTPEATPSPTPYVQPSYSPIKDPELSWMDYVYGGDTDSDFSTVRATRTPNPAATPRPTSQIINGNSSAAQIRELQWQLIELGWLDASSPSGRYDSATRQAVRDFQTYMNNTYAIDPKLTVDGIAGPATLYWLDQYSISYKPQATTRPATLPPVVTPTPGGSVINENSSKGDIRRVQQILIMLGMLPDGSDDGIYGAATRGAVWEFQDFVNDWFGSDVLQVTGEVDAATRSYMIAYARWWQDTQPTATPAPEATPEPTPGAGPDSPRETILLVQTLLKQLGFLDQVDGVYGQSTATAVRNFQNYVNQQEGYRLLDLTGLVDEYTLGCLYAYAEMGTPAPTATVTATPTQGPTPTFTLEPTDSPTSPPDDPGEQGDDDVVVAPGSDPESIYYMQQMLVSLGFLDNADGVYGISTRNAIQAFQNYVNQRFGYQVLAPDGSFTARTRDYLEQIYEDSQSQPVVTEPPMTEPPVTDPPVGEVTQPSVSFEGVDREDEGIRLVSADFTVRWQAQGDVAGYYVRITDENGDVLAEGNRSDTSLAIPVNNLQSDVVYELAVTAIPLNGSVEDGETTVEYFMRTSPQPTDPPVSEITAPQISIAGATRVEGDVSYISGDASFSWQSEGDVAEYSLTLYNGAGSPMRTANTTNTSVTIPSANLTAGEIYTLEVLAHPRGGNEDDALAASLRFALDVPATEPPVTEPPAAQIGTPLVTIGGATRVEGDVSYISGNASFSWSTEGDVAGYRVTFYNAAGNVLTRGNTTDTSVTIPAANLAAGEVYTIEVAAVPRGGDESQATVSTLRFALEAAATEPPVTEPPVTEPPVAQIGTPSINVAGATYGDDGVSYVSGNAAFAWYAEGDVAGYRVTFYDPSGGVITSGTTTDTSATIPAANLAAGEVYTVEVAAIPRGGDESQATTARLRFALEQSQPEPTEPPLDPDTGGGQTTMPATIDSSTGSEYVLTMQNKLIALGLLTAQDNPSRGVYDEGTRTAVLRFQQQYNAGNPGAPLVEIDPYDPDAVVDATTLQLLMAA